MLKVEVTVKLIFSLCILLSLRPGNGNYIGKFTQIKKVAESFNNVVGKPSIILGTMSRSWGVGMLTTYIRDGSIDDVRESLAQTLATLFTLDFGGGFVAPWIDDLIMDIVEKKEFENTRLALQNIDDDILDLVVKAQSLTPPDDPNGLIKYVEKLKKETKMEVLTKFDEDLKRASGNPNYSGRKYLHYAKRSLRLKNAGRVLGLAFDIAAIGINAWALGTTLRDCHEDPLNCNDLGIASASLSIAAGVVGIGTFVASLVAASAVVPAIGAAVATVLGLAATIVEIIGYVQAIQEKRETREKEYAMAELQYKSKFDLYIANQTKKSFGIGDKNIYVINQGHLPKFFNYHPSEIKFRSVEKNSSQPKCVNENAMCRTPLRPHSPKDLVHPHARKSRYICRYLVNGKKFTGKDQSKNFGYDFYGFAKNYGQYLKKESPPEKNIPNNGVAVLVDTKWVMPHELSKVNKDWGEIPWRGLNIDTSTRVENHEDTVDDSVSIDDMPNLNLDTPSGSDAALVHVRTGLGDDALIIKGRFGPFTSTKVLKADLGEGGNTVNFNRINSSSNIKGIIFNATTGDLYYKYELEQKLQHVGKILGVNSVTASPFNDEIQLSTSTVGSANDKYDFVVVKKKGLATYRIDISALAKLKKTKRFLIVDNTKRLSDTMDSYFKPPLLRHRNTVHLREKTCKDHAPLLQLFNFPSGAQTNDILYKDNQIFVYGLRNSKYGFTQNSHPQGPKAGCTGERGIWRNKIPLAIVSLRSSCPIEIEAKDRDGEYVMTRRKKYELDTRFFCGKRLRIDFRKKRYNGKNLDDYAVLECPSKDREVTEKTRIYLGKGKNYLVIGDELFLEPCGIDGDRVSIKLVKNKGTRNGWSLVLTGSGIERFSGEGLKIKIKGVKMIVNEAGNHLVDLREETKNVVDLYEKYVLSKITEVAKRFERDGMNEIKDELLTCIQESGNITDQERNDLCETNE